jgi:hypothetical protein
MAYFLSLPDDFIIYKDQLIKVSSKVTNKEELEDFFEKDRKFDELTDKEKYEYFMANQPISPDNIYFNSDLARKLRWKTLKNNIILK